jgi:hypothetical protein
MAKSTRGTSAACQHPTCAGLHSATGSLASEDGPSLFDSPGGMTGVTCGQVRAPVSDFRAQRRGRTVAADLWPEFRRLITDAGPSVVFGEQVASAGRWFDGVCDDLEAVGYTVGAAVLPACSVGHDHARARLFFAGHSDIHGKPGRSVDAEVARMPWSSGEPDGVVRQNGVSSRMVALAGFGNAVVPRVAAQFVGAYMDSQSTRNT